MNVIDLPASARVDTLFSPPYETRPPEVHNAELISPQLKALYGTLWHQNRPREEITVNVVRNALVDGPGLVFDGSFNLIKQTIHQATQSEIDVAYRNIHHFAANGMFATQKGVTLLCEKAGLNNYGHWLVEMLPIPFLNLKHLFTPGGWRLRLPVAGAAMNAVFRDSVKMIGVPQDQVRVRATGPQRYEQLVIVHGLSRHGVRYSPRIVECMDHLAADVPAWDIEKVWVSRAGDNRRIQEEDAVCDALAAQGWHIAEPGKMTLRDQIGLFKGARRIAGVNGAGLTNLVFAAADAEITSFVPCQMPDVFFWMMASFKRQRFREVRCQQVIDPRHPGGWNSALLISPRDVLKELNTPW
jgi:capsular polysaccharide biosynthesis protein